MPSNTDELVGIILAHLHNYGIKINAYFLGGSRRFNTASSSSPDIDLFCLIPGEVDRLSLQNAGFAHESSGDYPGTHVESTIFGVEVDLLLFRDPNEFGRLEKEHSRVEKYLEANPLLRDFISTLRQRTGVPGKDCYRALLRLIYLYR